MRSIKKLSKELLLISVIFLAFCTTAFSQDKIQERSFASAQKQIKEGSFVKNRSFYRSSLNANYFYTIKEDGDVYRLINKKGQDVFNDTYDTIDKNQYFIKTQKGDIVSIYRMFDLKKVKIPNLIQAYFIRDGLEVLTSNGAQYYDNTISKIDAFPPIEYFKCGTVYSENYYLKYNESTKKHTIKLSEGDFGVYKEEIILDLKGLPEGIESISFLSGKDYTSVSINNDYEVYPNIIKIMKDGKSGLYSYDIDETVYYKDKKKERKVFEISKVTGDTILMPPVVIDFTKKGNVKVKEVLPVVYDSIQQHPINGLVYLYKNDKKGIYPKHPTADFSSFDEKTRSFYSINKNGKWGWIDLKTFKEYYFE